MPVKIMSDTGPISGERFYSSTHRRRRQFTQGSIKSLFSPNKRKYSSPDDNHGYNNRFNSPNKWSQINKRRSVGDSLEKKKPFRTLNNSPMDRARNEPFRKSLFGGLSNGETQKKIGNQDECQQLSPVTIEDIMLREKLPKDESGGGETVVSLASDLTPSNEDETSSLVSQLPGEERRASSVNLEIQLPEAPVNRKNDGGGDFLGTTDPMVEEEIKSGPDEDTGSTARRIPIEGSPIPVKKLDESGIDSSVDLPSPNPAGDIDPHIKREPRDIMEPYPLRNLGNTCYMNSIVQSLFVFSLLMEELTAVVEKIRDAKAKEKLSMTHTLLSLFKLYTELKLSTTEPDVSLLQDLENRLGHLKECVGSKSSQFNTSYQQDAAEFFELIICSVEEEFEKVNELSAEFNPVKRNFQIDLDANLKCLKCYHVTNPPQTKVHALYLSISNDIKSLQDAIYNYFKEEKYEHKCEESGCDGKEKLRTTLVSKIPRILFLQLGRYSGGGEKRHEIVDVPVEVNIPISRQINPPASPIAPKAKSLGVTSLNGVPLQERLFRKIKDYYAITIAGEEIKTTITTTTTPTTDEKKNPSIIKPPELSPLKTIQLENKKSKTISHSATYQLVAVVCHIGNTLTGGHYISYLYNSQNESWYECDDQCITKMTIDKVMDCSKTSGYCFFYAYKSST